MTERELRAYDPVLAVKLITRGGGLYKAALGQAEARRALGEDEDECAGAA